MEIKKGESTIRFIPYDAKLAEKISKEGRKYTKNCPIQLMGIPTVKIYRIPVKNKNGVRIDKILEVKEGSKLFNKIAINGILPDHIIEQ